jgi:carbonic anhydrase
MLDELLERNGRFAQHELGELPSLPARGLVVLTCMDHRIDPAAALGLELGDAMVLRNAGGRVTPAFLDDLDILSQVVARRGGTPDRLELVLMQHTECGASELTGTEPHEGVRADIEALAADSRVPGSLSITGLVYETSTGRVELVERRSPLR